MGQGGLGGVLVLSRALPWGGMQDPAVGWDAGAHSGVGCRTRAALSPISARLKLLPNLRISMSLAS